VFLEAFDAEVEISDSRFVSSIASFTSTRYTCRRVRSRLGGTLNSRAALLNPQLKELNPTNTSSEPPSTAVVAVPESRFISARISKFFSSPLGTRGHPRRLHKRVPRIAFLICR